MKKIAVFSDIHGNFEALSAILNDIYKKKYDEVLFLGDAIGIGPSPYECLNTLLNDNNITFIYGNHEMYSLLGCTNFSNISLNSRSHHLWTEKQIEPLKNKLKKKMIYEKKIEDVKFFHYAKDDKDIILRPNDFPTIDYLDNLFKDNEEQYIIFGHSHNTNYNIGKKNYYCLGSSGCVKDDNTFYTEIIIDKNVSINKINIKYDREKFIKKFNQTDFPLKIFMGNVFFNIKDDLMKKKIIAHRGIHNNIIPENSMRSFKKAIFFETPIELDIHILKDNNIIVFHDDNLKRMTGLNKKVKDCTYDEIKHLKLNNKEDHIPLLKDVLNLVNGKVLLNIELKKDSNNYKLEDNLIKILEYYNGKFVLQTFSIKSVLYLKKHTNYKIGLLIPNLENISKFKKNVIKNINFNIIIKPHFISCNKNILNYRCIKKFNKEIFIWTINKKEELNKYEADYYISEDIF